jgi:hypothetical protein
MTRWEAVVAILFLLMLVAWLMIRNFDKDDGR